MSTPRSPAAAVACSKAKSKPSVTKKNVVPPAISIGSRAWWVSTKTGAWYGGSSPHQPRQSSSHSPRIGPNMFRPMTYAPRGRMSQPTAVASASLARSSPRCQAWSSRPRFPSGSSRLWSGPATKPSSEIDMWQVVSGITRCSVPAPQRGAEHVVPERGADAEAACVVLEVVAHVELPHHLPEARLRTVVVQEVVRHVVDEVAEQEPGREDAPLRRAHHQHEQPEEPGRQRHAHRRRHHEAQRVVRVVVVHAVDDPVEAGAEPRVRLEVED